MFNWLFNRPYLLLTLTAVFWGGNAVAGKLAVDHVSPFLLTLLRWIVAMAIVYPFAWPHLKRDWPVIRQHLPFMFVLGAIGFTTFNNLMYFSLTLTTALNVAIIQASMPLAVFLLNFLLFSLRATPIQLAGFFLTLVGVTVIAAKGQLANLIGLNFNFGDLLMFFAIMAYGIYSVLLLKKPDVHWLSFIAVLGTSAMITATGFAAIEIGNGTVIWPDTRGWLVVAYTAVFASIVSQVFWMRGLELIGSNRGGVFINIVPIVGTGLAILILGERFHLYHAFALSLVLGGVWLAQQGRKLKAA